MKLAVFGHDANDAALAKRIGQMQADGHAVHGLTMRRGAAAPFWPNTDLGETRPGAFAARLLAMARAVSPAARALASPDVVWARNLDAAIVAIAAMKRAGCAAPFVYECLDIHDLASGKGPAAKAVRTLEAKVLARAALTVVSSPAFAEHHFQRRYGDVPIALVENRLARATLPARPMTAPVSDSVLTIGWFGVLRCRRSLDLLLALADTMGGRVRIVMRGRPAQGELPDFEGRVAACPHASFEGPYTAPGDLARIYADIDLVWAGDWFQAGANSRWLLPNRLYEGGWFGVPALAPAGTETAKWITRNGTGIVLEEPVAESLHAFAAGLTPPALAILRARTLSAPDDLFVAQPKEITQVLERVIR